MNSRFYSRLKIVVSIACFSSIFWGGGDLKAAETSASILTLSDAMTRSLNQSLEAKRAALAVQQAELNASLIEKSSDPKLSLSGKWGSRWQKKTSESSAAFKSINRIHSYDAQASYTLYDFGRQASKELAARETINAESLAREEVEEELFWRVVRAYQDVIAAERLVAISKEQLELTNGKLTEQNRIYKQGLRPESDVVTAQVDLGKARLVYQQALDDAFLARRDLSNLIEPDMKNSGTNFDSPEKPAFQVEMSGVAAGNPEQWEAFANDVLKTNTNERAAVKALQAAKAALKAEDDAVSASTKPTLSAVAGGEWSTESGDWEPLRPAASGQLQLSWDIPWNGMNRISRELVSSKRQDIEMRETLLRQETDQTEEHARLQLAQAKNLFESLKQQASLVVRQRQLVQARYQAGQASALEVSTAEAALLGVKLDQAKLSNTVAIGLIAMARARGVRDIELLKKL